MTPRSRVLLTIDRGHATTAVALLAQIAGRWRLLGSMAMPATVDPEAVCERTLAVVRSADPDLATDLGLDADSASALERREVRSGAVGTLAVVTATERVQTVLAPIVATSGWRAVTATVETHDPRTMTALLLDPGVTAVLASADQRAGADERGTLGDLGALLAAVAQRRPDLPIILSGAMGSQEARIRGLRPTGSDIVLAPDATAGEPAGSALRAVLVPLGQSAGDARERLAAGVELLADVLDRRVELLEIGAAAGTRVLADPPTAGATDTTRAASVAAAALIPSDLDDETLDGVARWSTATLDRHRLRDRLADLAAHPWADAAGDGARLRIAAARAAVGRLVAATAELFMGPTPDLVVIGGGAWAVAPAPAISLAIADVLRRPIALQLAYDHARLLAPIAAMDDREDARSMLADLADDALAPLGGLVMPAVLRTGRLAGEMSIDSGTDDGPLTMDLAHGGVEFVDLAPGLMGRVEVSFRDPVILGGRGRRFGFDVAGGLGGLLVDLRGIPLTLPDRSDLRRELLGGWQDALWAADER